MDAVEESPALAQEASNKVDKERSRGAGFIRRVPFATMILAFREKSWIRERFPEYSFMQ